MLRLALPVASLALLASSPALAQKRLAIVDLATPPTMIGLGSQVSATIQKAAKDQGYAVTSPDQLRTQLGEQLYNELVLCVGKPACVASKLASLKLDRAVAGSLNRDDRNYLVKLQLIDLEKGEILSEVDRSILIASRRLVQDVTAAVPRMLRGEREAHGTLKLSANVKSANVTIDGEFAGVTPLSVQLKPGKHEVKLDKKSYLPVTRLVNVEPGAVTQEEVRLILVPGERPEEEVVPPMATAKLEAPGGLKVPTAAWVTLGGGALVAGVGAIFGLSASRTEQELTAGYDPARDVYASRRDALSGQQSATIANVLYGVAGAAAVAAVVITIAGQGEDSPAVGAAVTPGGGAVTLRGSF